MYPLIIGAFNETHPQRSSEYLQTLKQNLDLPHISMVVVVQEETVASWLGPLLNHYKLKVLSPIGKRATYRYMFNLAATMYPGKVVILANSDVYFDYTLQKLQYYHFTRDTLFCLSKWNQDLIYKPLCSQDAWVFMTPLPYFPCDFPMGHFCCDGVIAHNAKHARMKVINPSLTIRLTHLHDSKIRHYARVPVGTRVHYVPATELPLLYPQPQPQPKPGVFRPTLLTRS